MPITHLKSCQIALEECFFFSFLFYKCDGYLKSFLKIGIAKQNPYSFI